MVTVDDKDVARHAAARNGPSAPSRLAQTIDHQRADDLVQETWVRAFPEDPGAFERPRLVQILTDLAAGGEYSIEVRPAEAEGAENASEHVRGLFSSLLCRR